MEPLPSPDNYDSLPGVWSLLMGVKIGGAISTPARGSLHGRDSRWHHTYVSCNVLGWRGAGRQPYRSNPCFFQSATGRGFGTLV